MREQWSVLGGVGQCYDIEELTAVLRDGDGHWPLVIANHNLHSLYLLRRSKALREFFASMRVVHIDGMPIVWLARLLGYRVRREHRVTYVDWLPRVLDLASKNRWRVFFLGSSSEAVVGGLEVIRSRYPGVVIEGRDGFFDAQPGSTENAAIVERIQRFDADLLLVGMGMPRQETWILESGLFTGARRILPCGAALDFLSGAVATPPRWLGPVGLEWLHRLVHEPRRLAGRYLTEPLILLLPFMAELIRKRF